MSFLESNFIFAGGHLPFSKDITPTVNLAIENKMNCLQFFMGNPKSVSRQRLDTNDIKTSYNLCNTNIVNVYSHFPYTCSLTGTVSQLAWDGCQEQDRKTGFILKELENELNTLAKISPINGVVIHPGSYKNTEAGLETIAKSINKINFDENATLLLENSAGEGTKIPRNFKEIKVIFDNLDIIKKKNVGVCVDTAHIHGVGEYNLSKRDDVDKLFNDFDRYIGMEKFNLLHLNDSMIDLGNKKDRHECLGYGKIWKDNKNSLEYLLTRCGEYNIPIILETPNIEEDYKYLLSL